MRIDKSETEKVAVIINFTPVHRENYVLGVPEEGEFTTVLSTNAKSWGGDGKRQPKVQNARGRKPRLCTLDKHRYSASDSNVYEI